VLGVDVDDWDVPSFREASLGGNPFRYVPAGKLKYLHTHSGREHYKIVIGPELVIRRQSMPLRQCVAMDDRRVNEMFGAKSVGNVEFSEKEALLHDGGIGARVGRCDVSVSHCSGPVLSGA
jgi:hypothetical protein